ncbi:hypothetical protein BH09GEM1_BH09GEM1_02210 [soil metagenome]
MKQWEIVANNSTTGVASPVTYGATVTGATPATASPLVSGVHYVVTVIQLRGKYGQQEFVP